MKHITVFCGSSSGFDPVYAQAAQSLGKTFAAQNITLIYGGGKVGLMGILADAVLENGGKVTGVIPGFLNSKEIAHNGLTELIGTESMHERKMKMHNLCDAVIALPGGYGTLDELFEMLTWAQLGLHTKPIGILNVNGYYDHLCGMAAQMMRDGFLKQDHFSMLQVSNTIEDLLTKMKNYQAPELPKWISSETT